MPKVYIKCTHCGEMRLVEDGGKEFGGDFVVKKDDEFLVKHCVETSAGFRKVVRTVILMGICEKCCYRILNTGRKMVLRNSWSSVSRKDQLDD